MLYLDPGQIQPVRLTYEIGSEPTWVTGNQLQVPMGFTLQEESVTNGQAVSAPLTVTLPNVVNVVSTGLIGTFDPPPNATIAGTVRHADTGLPYATAALLVDGGQMASKFGTWDENSAEFVDGRWRLR